ncbi:tryptophan--tRNA ligase [Fimbriimonas ginsengisoli]|uniref:Tryptophan--tRNA ligase n=1 Tax=Fimbriimonas ginsengisoli Gsoil 348 TaxID=661478 RepID=A0A068NIV1_FIMGI|nr:tryptophan--tRNA ligase [Fimbriimonas ginsengisoli]AIE83451.1 tryptophanyl-tRNA synthetase [Fimbriimonas ginsengisoli Gsoil 348]
MTTSKRILSGMRSSNPRLHIGNYEGALRNWVDLQEQGYHMFCMVADWHALTTMYENAGEVSRNAREVAKDYVAAGIDPVRSPVFIQSHVKEHAELHMLLSMITPLGWLERTPTYKEKQADLGSAEREPYGLLGYPVLQTADILLYKPYGVPVGRDQAPHLEIGNDIGQRFNRLYNVEVFPEYKYLIPQDETRAKLPGLDMRKMSKSYDNCIYLSDTEDQTAEKIKSAFTTPTKIRKTDPGIPEGCAVCQYLKVYSPTWQTQWQEDRDGLRGCMQNKKECTEAINEYFRPMRQRRAQLDDATIEGILADGAIRAREVAQATMSEVRAAMGIY